LKTRTQEFREQRVPEQQDAGEVAEAIRAYILAARVRDGLVPVDED
jgi:hypothetical protein